LLIDSRIDIVYSCDSCRFFTSTHAKGSNLLNIFRTGYSMKAIWQGQLIAKITAVSLRP